MGLGAGLLVCELDLYLTSAVLHRGLTHGAIRYPRWLERAVAVWLWATVCIPPLTWIAAHRHHHVHSDTEDDPHPTALLGVWRVGLLSWYYVTRWARSHRELAEERYLKRFREERLLHGLDGVAASYANFWGQILASLALGPVAVAFWLGRVPTYILLSGYVNAAGHSWGERPFPTNLGTDATAPPFQLAIGWITGGEPLGHNYHHRYPTSPTFRPNAFDPGYWFATRVLRGVPVDRRSRQRANEEAA
jgi:stearoyl-CoA desaturase (delta-9 desaturase)